MPRKHPFTEKFPDDGDLPAEARLLEQLRRGDAEAGRRFVREQYPAVYRYLVHLTGRPDLAADLTQETFLQAWRYLDRFEPRAPLRAWLHRIAHREFLQALRAHRPLIPIGDVPELTHSHAADAREAVELRQVIAKLSVEEREAVVLHYLEGYSCAEIARIVRAPVSTIKYRLSIARSHLQQELGEGDLTYLNGHDTALSQWAWLPMAELIALEAHCQQPSRQLEDSSMPSDKLSRRHFLTTVAGAGAAALTGPMDAEVVDDRLTRKVTLAAKATALSDLCDHLRSKTAIHLTARPSVADEKVTLFCQKLPLREVMRQLSRPFGYTWVRSGAAGQYRYELEQDLRSQLLEEELRNRDGHTALLALEHEIQRFRPYLALSPDEARAQAASAPPMEKPLLEILSGSGWGPIQLYFRLSPQELAALRAGEKLTFSQSPFAGERPLPTEVARGVIQSYRGVVVRRSDAIPLFHSAGMARPGDVLLTADPLVRARVRIWMKQSELGQFTLNGTSAIFLPTGAVEEQDQVPCASGTSPLALKLDNAAANAKLARDPSLRTPVTVQPKSSCVCAPESSGPTDERRVTTADVLEALHHATGMPIISDFYTRLHTAAELSLRQQPLFSALNQLGDRMGLRWNRDGEWLQFRTTTYYHDRLKEVPNRLLARWAAARRLHGQSTLQDLVEIAQLPDAQLNGRKMAEGARECWGLLEWELARNLHLRAHLRYLAAFTPAQCQETLTSTGLPFSRMSIAQQQQFLAQAFSDYPLWPPIRPTDDLTGAALRVEYTVPGWFQWGNPAFSWHWSRYLVVVEPGEHGRWMPRPPIRERTREAAIQAVRQVAPEIRNRAIHVLRDLRGRQDPEPDAPWEAQIFPTTLGLTFIYVPGASNERMVHVAHRNGDSWNLLW
jgi:RNA polymerase sigma-70 factor (ECF subfamily)